METQNNNIDKYFEIVVIGGSSGSMEVFKQIIPSLRKDLKAAVIVVYHTHPDSGDFMVTYLAERSEISVRQAEDKEIIENGVVYFSPPNYHVLIEQDRSIALSIDTPVNYSRPSIDVLFESAADVYADKLIGIILTGANTDGSKGLRYIKEKGGLAVVQSPETAEMDTMPIGAMTETAVDYVLEPDKIGLFVNKMTK